MRMLGVAYIRFGITGQLCYNVYEIKFFINKKRRNAYVDKEMIKNIFLQTDVMITEKFADDDLRRLLSYTQNQDKTEHQLYVTGFHC